MDGGSPQIITCQFYFVTLKDQSHCHDVKFKDVHQHCFYCLEKSSWCLQWPKFVFLVRFHGNVSNYTKPKVAWQGIKILHKTGSCSKMKD